MSREIRVCALVFFLLTTSLVFAQTGTIKGRVADEANHVLPGASVVIVDTQIGAVVDSTGEYVIRNLQPGKDTLRVTMIGYTPANRVVTVVAGSAVVTDFRLKAEPLRAGEVTVTTKRQTKQIEAGNAVQIENIPVAELKRISADQSVLSALAKESGLTVRPSDLSGSGGVSMQGLEPSYTEVSVDGMPVFSGLGALYGLEGVFAEDISEVEVEKGSGSEESGSGAIAGEVNLVSAKPSNRDALNVNVNGGDTGQYTVSAAGSHPLGSVPARLSATFSSQPNKVDYNHDGITDTPQYTRFNVNAGVATGEEDDGFSANVTAYEESRFAGETRWNTSDRGSADVYGRDILTHRQEAALRYAAEGGQKWDWSLDGAFVNHRQNSWYGMTHYDALQREALAQLSADVKWDTTNTTHVQGTFEYNDYSDNLKLGTPTALRYRIPGLMVQHLWSPNEAWTVQAGSRVEYYKGSGVVATPRGALQWQANPYLSFRLSGGAGFRPVSIFSIDESVQAGFEHILVPGTLQAEHSTSGNFSVDKQWILGQSVFHVNASLFYTRIPNKVILLFGPGPDTTTYINARDAYSRGGELQIDWRHTDGWSVRADFTRADMRYLDVDGWHQEPEEFLFSGNGSILKTWTDDLISAELTTQLFGPRARLAGRGGSKTPIFYVWDLGLSKTWGHVTTSGQAQNLFNWTQPDNPYLRDPLTGKLLYDSLLLYGPQLGRTFYLSISYST